MKKKRLKLIALLVITLIIGVIPVSASQETIRLKDLPTGSIVYDPSWTWEHKTGDGYTGSGEIKPVEWAVVAKNHTGYPTNSVTLISNELIGKYYFDDSTDRGSSYGSNHWGNSGTTNAKHGIRKFLNGDSYTGNDNNSYPISFFNTFSSDFKDLVLETTLNMKDYNGNSYTSKDKVFLPSENELGGNYTTSDGNNWGYFNTNASRIAKIGSNNWYYRTRSPWSGRSYHVRYVFSDGSFHYNGANDSRIGVRPALNLKSDTLVKSVGGNKYEIVHHTPPELTIGDYNKEWTNKNIDLEISIKKGSNDIKKVTMINNDKETEIVKGESDKYIATITKNGTYTFKVADIYNNESLGKTITITNIDKIPPKMLINISNQ